MTASLRIWGLAVGAVWLLSACGGEEQSSAPLPTTPSMPTPETPSPEDAAADGALAAFEDAVRVTDQASQDPASRDWEPEIRRHLGDPAALLAVQSVRDYAALGLRQEGTSAVSAAVSAVDLTAAEGPTVRITGCFDSGSTRVINTATGEAVPTGTPPRYTWDVAVTQFSGLAGQPWLVTELEPLTDQPC